MKVCKHCMRLEVTHSCMRKPALFRDDEFPWKYFLNIFFFQAELTSLIVPRTSWKINSKVFEILQWIGQSGELEPVFICFPAAGGIGACWLRRYLFCLLLQTSWRVLIADGQKWDKPKAAVCSCFLTNCLYFCQVICFIICYCGTRSYLVFWLSENSFFSREESSVDVLHLAFGGATCPAWRQLWASEECISSNEPGTDWPLKGAWFSVK